MSLRRVAVGLGHRAYAIHIGPGAIGEAAAWRDAVRGRHALVVANPVVGAHYAARVVAERMWHSTQAIRKLKPDGSGIEFQADLSGLEEITRWVLSWGSKARVLGPSEPKKRVKDELAKMTIATG